MTSNKTNCVIFAFAEKRHSIGMLFAYGTMHADEAVQACACRTKAKHTDR